MMGWRVSEKGFSLVLSREVPSLVRKEIGHDVDAFLGDYGHTGDQIGSWVLHTGGPKVLQAMQDSLDLKDGQLEASWDCLRRTGNLSSASVLIVLEEVIKHRRPAPGTLGLMAAMGPGFCSEILLLQW
jgi:alkylresorcinol/alkylpyrone synthase